MFFFYNPSAVKGIFIIQDSFCQFLHPHHLSLLFHVFLQLPSSNTSFSAKTFHSFQFLSSSCHAAHDHSPLTTNSCGSWLLPAQLSYMCHCVGKAVGLCKVKHHLLLVLLFSFVWKTSMNAPLEAITARITRTHTVSTQKGPSHVLVSPGLQPTVPDLSSRTAQILMNAPWEAISARITRTHNASTAMGPSGVLVSPGLKPPVPGLSSRTAWMSMNAPWEAITAQNTKTHDVSIGMGHSRVLVSPGLHQPTLLKLSSRTAWILMNAPVSPMSVQVTITHFASTTTGLLHVHVNVDLQEPRVAPVLSQTVLISTSAQQAAVTASQDSPAKTTMEDSFVKVSFEHPLVSLVHLTQSEVQASWCR